MWPMYLLLSNWPLRQASELDQYSVGGGCTTHLPPTSTSKIHQYMEQFLLKISWRLAERLLYNHGCKKNPHGTGEKEKSIWGRTCAPERGLKEKGRLHAWRSLRNKQLEPHIGHPSHKVQQKEDKTPWLFGGSVGLTVEL